MLCTFCFAKNPSFRENPIKGGHLTFCNTICQSRYYFINGTDKKKLKTTEPRSFDNCDGFGEVINIPIDQIICGQLRIGREWKQILSGVQCTKIGARVAKSLVRVASTRIFADPTQSILEPIVNSIDAYFPEQRTGKFGMGFFSLLYWVVTHNAKISIHSAYQIGNDIYCGYKAVIYANGESLMIKLEDDDHSNHKKSFTSIYIEFPIDYKLKDRFFEQLGKLEFVPVVNIFVNGFELNGKRPIHSKAIVDVRLDFRGILCQDTATGITRNVLLGSLLFPTVSTKTIQMSTKTITSSYTPRFIVEELIDSKKNRLSILVNNIMVINMLFKTPISKKFLIIIDLPPWTKIPVSRDDIYLESVKDIFNDNIKHIYNHLSTNYKTIIPIEYALDNLHHKTLSELNHGIISDSSNVAKWNLDNVLFIHDQYEFIYNHVGYLFSQQFVTSKEWNPDSIYDAIRKSDTIVTESDYFFDKKVIFFDTDSSDVFASTGGLQKNIFVNKQMTEDVNWANNLAISFYETTLYPRNVDKPEHVLELEYLLNDSKLSGLQKELLKTIFSQEETLLRNGWRGYTDIAKSVKAYKRLIKYGLCTDKFLEIITTQWYPAFIEGPRTYMYDKIATYTAFNNLTYETFFQTSEFEKEGPPYAIPKYNIDPKGFTFSKKALQFALEFFQQSVTENVVERDNIYHLSLTSIYENALFPILSAVYDEFTNGLFELMIEKCSTFVECYQCHAVLLHLADKNHTHEVNVWRYMYDKNDTDDDDDDDDDNDDYDYANDEDNIYQYMSKINKDNIEDVTNQFIHLIRDAYKNDMYLKWTFSNGDSITLDLDGYYDATIVCAGAFIMFLKELVVEDQPNGMEIKKTLPIININQKSANFTLNKFIDYTFKHDFPNNNIEFLSTLRYISDEISLSTQMIEIVVNEGTSKEPVLAQITETIQNSIDAIKEYKPRNSNIDLQIYHVNDTLILQIKDYVGINTSGVIAMSIPFYSTKTPNQIMTGEMGTGFFNVYRSNKVFIKTTRDEIVYEIVDIPIRDLVTSRVLDVNRHLYTYKKNNTQNETEITIFIEKSRTKSIYTETSRAISFVQSVISLIQPPNQGVITLNGKSITRQLKLLHSQHPFEFYKSEPESGEFTSYIQTKGIPFAPLLSYVLSLDNNISIAALQFLSNNYVLNITSNYTPVQTRTKITLDRKYEDLFSDMIEDVAYEHVISMPLDKIKQYIEFYDSGTKKKDGQINLFAYYIDARQILPNKFTHYKSENNSKSTFFMYYRHSELTMNFVDILYNILDEYTIGIEMLNYDRNFGDIDKLDSIKHPINEIHKKLNDIAKGWFDGKNIPEPPDIKFIPTKHKHKQVVLEDEKIDPRYEKIQIFLTGWINMYVEIGQKLEIFPNERRVKSVNLLEKHPTASAFYNPQDESINIVIAKEILHDHIEIINVFLLDNEREMTQRISELERTNNTWKYMYSPNGTISHEVEHFRRHTSHAGEGAHSETLVWLPVGGQKIRHFQQCYIDTAKSIMINGFYSHLRSKMTIK